jgi:hypothetical protein
MASKYEELLKGIARAAELEKWLEGERGGQRISTKEGNLWSLAYLAAGLQHYLLRHIYIHRSEAMDRADEAIGMQAAFELIPEAPASAADLRNIIHGFFGTQGLEDNDAGRPPKPDQPPSSSTEASRPVDVVNDVPPAQVLEAIVPHLDGRFNWAEAPAIVSLWTPAERAAARDWGVNRAAGGEAPEPEVLTRRYLEDMIAEDLETGGSDSWGWLLDQVHVPNIPMSREAQLEILPWATAAHRRDRGESTFPVPEMPTCLVPEAESYAVIKARVFSGGASRSALFEEFGGEELGISFVLDALEGLREVRAGETIEWLVADEEGLHSSLAHLEEVARASAERREPDLVAPPRSNGGPALEASDGADEDEGQQEAFQDLVDGESEESVEGDEAFV